MRHWLVAIAFMSACLAVTRAQNRPAAPMAPPGETGRRITDDGLIANYFPARRGPALLILGGSIGGLSPEANRMAIELQKEGFSTLHLAYFRAPGQSPRLELAPLEYFDRALEWLRKQPEVDRARVGIIGGSKGAEAALLVAARDAELKAVIASLPSSVIWPGFNESGSSAGVGSAWSEGGRALRHLPHRPYDGATGATMADGFAASLKSVADHEYAVIPVEKIRGALFLVCGEADQVWPSCPMARQIAQRLRDLGRPPPVLLAYEGAGHSSFGVPAPPANPRPAGGGGDPERTYAARADSWPKAIAFLKAILSTP